MTAWNALPLAPALRWHFDIGHSKVATHFNEVLELGTFGFPKWISLSAVRKQFRPSQLLLSFRICYSDARVHSG